MSTPGIAIPMHSAHSAGTGQPSLPSNIFQTIQHGPPRGDLAKGLERLRYAVLTSDGVPAELRIYIWMVLLDVPPVKTQTYLDLVGQGASPSYEKIRNDTFRTLATDPLFRRRVTENSLMRVLNAVSWRIHDAHEARVNGWQSPPSIGHNPPLSFSGSPEAKPESPAALRIRRERELELDRSIDVDAEVTATTPMSAAVMQTASPLPRLSNASATATSADPTIGYVQGMNVLAAPFLYVARSEVQAFAAYNKLITSLCPAYVRGGSVDGVHRGLALVDRILAIVDPKLAAHLAATGLNAAIYGFASVLTLCACTPPLPEVLVLWDFLFAYGPHLNLLCIVAQLVLIREQLLASPSPNQILRSLPPLQAAKIKAMSISFLRKIPDGLYEEIVMHAR